MHKATIAVCVAEAGRDGEVRFVGKIPKEPAALDKLAARLGRGGRTLRFAYEAGLCGYEVYRHLRDRGHECVVVAPSLIPRKPGERAVTDRRDATALARLYRADQFRVHGQGRGSDQGRVPRLSHGGEGSDFLHPGKGHDAPHPPCPLPVVPGA